MMRVPGNLANVVDMIDHYLQIAIHCFGIRFPPYPTGHHHPGIQCRAYNGAAINELFYLLVAILAVMINQLASVVVAGPYRTVKMVERFPKAVIAKVGCIQNYI